MQLQASPTKKDLSHTTVSPPWRPVKEDGPHKHRRGQQQTHRGKTRERGRGKEERLNLLGDEDPDQRLYEAQTAWTERGPRTAGGPAQRSLSEGEEEEEKVRERERERHSLVVCRKQK